MKELTRTEVCEFLRSHDRFCILTHRRPDGDTLGSAAALCRGLRTLGKSAFLLENPEVTPKYRPFVEGLAEASCPEDATVITVDIADEKLLTDAGKELLPRIQMLIDHHATNSRFAPAGHVDPGSAACGEIVWEILKELGISMDKPTAEAIYTAVSTDTGCFRYSNTTAHTLRTAAACLEAGADTFPINRKIFEMKRLPKLRMEAYLADHLELFKGGEVAFVQIPRQAELECGVEEDDMEDVSNFARRIEGVELAVTFRTENSSGDTKLSVRSGPAYDASRICGLLGGGGHRAASGAKLACSMEEARTRVLAAIRTLGYL